MGVQVVDIGVSRAQVACEGIRLIGRVPSELSSEMEAWALEHGKGIWFGPAGDLSWPDFEFDRGARRAGDTVVSWAVFFNTGDIAGSSWTSIQERSGTTGRSPPLWIATDGCRGESAVADEGADDADEGGELSASAYRHAEWTRSAALRLPPCRPDSSVCGQGRVPNRAASPRRVSPQTIMPINDQRITGSTFAGLASQSRASRRWEVVHDSVCLLQAQAGGVLRRWLGAATRIAHTFGRTGKPACEPGSWWRPAETLCPPA